MFKNQMKKINHRYIILFAILSCTLYFGVKHLQATSPMFNFFFSPDDLYEQLACSDIDLSAEGSSVSLDFVNNYPGNHWIEIIVDNPTDLHNTYETKFELNIEIKDNDKELLATTANQPEIPFWGVKDHSGFAILTYDVPSKLPIRTQLTANITVKKADADFDDLYGKQRLCIKKYSDE